MEFDRSECVEECLALDREPSTQPLVERHVSCVDRAASCEVVLACD